MLLAEACKPHSAAQFTSAAVIILATCAAEWLVLPRAWYNGGDRYCRARVGDPSSEDAKGRVVELTLMSGPSRGRRIRATYPTMPGADAKPAPGAEVLVAAPGEEGKLGQIVGLVRDRWLLRLIGILCLLLVLAGGARGVRGILILAFVGATLYGVLAPLAMRGIPPLLCVSAVALLMTLVISVSNVGWQRSVVAVTAGTVGGLAVIIALSAWSVHALRMTGVYSWLTRSLWEREITRGLDFRGLLAAGMVLGAMGVVMDLATAVAASVREVAEVDPSRSWRGLFSSGLNVGRDVMGTEVNTLVFAYVGANVGVLLMPVLGQRVRGFGLPALHVLSMQSVAAGITQTLIGTIGLVLTIPITAWVAAFVLHSPRVASDAGGAASPGSGSGPSFRWSLVATALAGLALLWLMAERRVLRSFHRYQRRQSESGEKTRMLVHAEVASAEPSAREILGRGARLRGEAHQTIRCRLTSGPQRGKSLEGINPISGRLDHDKPLRPGDRVLLRVSAEDGELSFGGVLEYARGPQLVLLAFLLLAVIVVVGHWPGIRATAALLCSGAIIYACAMAVGLREWPALPTFLGATLPLSVLVFLILCGPTQKALCASLGAFGGILVGGLSAGLCSSRMGFTGLHVGDLMALRLFAEGGGIDYRGLYVAGVLLGIVGVAMDVAIAMASAADEIRQAKPDVAQKEVFERTLRVGRQVMLPMVLALVLAYVGVNLPILLLPLARAATPLALLTNMDPVAAEALRILAGSIGVVATVPITAGVCAAFVPTRA